jgi:hypothetical protein
MEVLVVVVMVGLVEVQPDTLMVMNIVEEEEEVTMEDLEEIIHPIQPVVEVLSPYLP